jgi:hypothetical protein
MGTRVVHPGVAGKPRASGQPLMPQKPPMSVRLPDGDKEWLERAAADAGMTPHAFLRQLVADARAAAEKWEITR